MDNNYYPSSGNEKMKKKKLLPRRLIVISVIEISHFTYTLVLLICFNCEVKTKIMLLSVTLKT